MNPLEKMNLFMEHTTVKCTLPQSEWTESLTQVLKGMFRAANVEGECWEESDDATHVFLPVKVYQALESRILRGFKVSISPESTWVKVGDKLVYRGDLCALKRGHRPESSRPSLEDTEG